MSIHSKCWQKGWIVKFLQVWVDFIMWPKPSQNRKGWMKILTNWVFSQITQDVHLINKRDLFSSKFKKYRIQKLKISFRVIFILILGRLCWCSSVPFKLSCLTYFMSFVVFNPSVWVQLLFSSNDRNSLLILVNDTIVS